MEIGRIVTAGLAVLLASCTKEAPPSGEGQQAPAAAGGTSAGVREGEPEAGGERWVVTRAGLRRTKSETAKVPDESGKAKVSNWLSTLQRGERVHVLEDGGDWLRVRASDDQEGWLPSKTVLAAEGAKPAGVLEELQTFERPDLVAVSPVKLAPGTLLFVVGEKGQFSEVNVSHQKTLWVITVRLTFDEREVEVSRMIENARYLKEKKKGEGLPELWTVAKAQLDGSKLLDVLKGIASPDAAAAGTATAAAVP